MLTSEESDDEPLALLATAKRLGTEISINNDEDSDAESSFEIDERHSLKEEGDSDEDYDPKQRKKAKKAQIKVCNKAPMTIKVGAKRNNQVTKPAAAPPPNDVWLYLKDLKAKGPYSCLLCPELFIGKAKLMVHYMLDHKKYYCGICRYLVTDRQAWEAHSKLHMPWTCSQCLNHFTTESDLQEHLSTTHNLVDCRICQFRVPDGENYYKHLIQKHNLTNIVNRNEEIVCSLNNEDSGKFLCQLCLKSDNLTSHFFNHYMGYHRFTLRCLSTVLSGKDYPISISGAQVTPQFIESIKVQGICGYVTMCGTENVKEEQRDTQKIVEVKQEQLICDTEETKDDIKERKIDLKSYQGDDDFDVTLMELIVLHSCYFDYLSKTVNDINSNIMPEDPVIDYQNVKSKNILNIDCSLCSKINDSAPYQTTIPTFVSHMQKMHCVRSEPLYFCRACTMTFETEYELETHVSLETKDFTGLWICQFCDKEFENRALTRQHLSEHGDMIQDDNCFSPHLGFKCKYCPMLFWNEPQREQHQIREHLEKNKKWYYTCECNEVFSDKVWLTYHYLDKHQKEDSKQLYLVKCCLCSLVYSTVELLRSHFEAKHPLARKIFCSLDGCHYKPLSHKKSFQLHVKAQHAASVRKDFACACNVCGREFPTARARSAHIAFAHGAPGRYRCKLCGELLHSTDERKVHYLLRHPGHSQFECSECGKSFQYKSSLYLHKRDHSPEKKTLICPVCKKAFAKKDSYREHLMIHEGPQHACSYCPMRFVQRGNMLRHERLHTGERPYSCLHCERTFPDKGACNSHMRVHNKTNPSFACLYCGQTFAQKSKLTYHTRLHTGENLETCTVCSKIFTSSYSLKEHMKRHDDKKNESAKCPLCVPAKFYRDERYMMRHYEAVHSGNQYPCPLCANVSGTTLGWRKHVYTHCKRKPYSCKRCSKCYSVRNSMVKHLRRRHGLKGSITNARARGMYIELDPRECGLDLEEEVITRIFGPPRKTRPLCVPGQFVTDKPDEEEESTDDDEDNDGDRKDSDKESDGEVDMISFKPPDDQDIEQELEPTDFICVKIEQVDNDDHEY